jgi:hypothetical protein
MQEDLSNKLWDYVYGLLDQRDAQAIEARITSDHDVARAYAEVRQLADKLAAAARYDIPPVKLIHPREPVCLPTPALAAASPVWLVARWLIASAALLLVAVAGYTWQQQRRLTNPDALAALRDDLAARQVRLVLSGPAEVPAGVANRFTVLATDLDGAPQSIPLAYRFETSADGEAPLRELVTDANGHALIPLEGLAAGQSANLQVWCKAQDSTPPLSATVRAAPPAIETVLASDKSHYRPGDVVHFRSVTLANFGRPQPQDLVVDYDVRDLSGRPVPGTRVTGLTAYGVGNGTIQLAQQCRPAPFC